MTGMWVSLIALLGCLLLTGLVAFDRNRLKHRLGRAEGDLAGLRLDLAAARDHIAELNAGAGEAAVPDRWSPSPGQGVDAESAVLRRPSRGPQ